MSLSQFGLEGMEVPPRVVAVLSKLGKELEGLNRQKRKDDRTLKSLRDKIDALTARCSELQGSLEQTSDAFSELQIKHSKQQYDFSRRNRYLEAKIESLRQVVNTLGLEKDEMTETMEQLIQRIEAGNKNQRPAERSRLILQSALEPQRNTLDNSQRPTAHNDGNQYAAAMIANLTSKLEQTQEFLDILREDSEVNISVLEAKIARRDVQLQAHLTASGIEPSARPSSPHRHRRVDRSALLHPPNPAKSENLGLEENVRRIARKLEKMQLASQQAQDGDDTPHVSTEAPSAAIATAGTLDVEVTPQLRPPLEEEPPRSPRFLAVLQDLGREIDRLTADLAGLRAEREHILQLGRNAARHVSERGDTSGAGTQGHPPDQPDVLLLEQECLRLTQAEAASKRLVDDLRRNCETAELDGSSDNIDVHMNPSRPGSSSPNALHNDIPPRPQWTERHWTTQQAIPLDSDPVSSSYETDITGPVDLEAIQQEIVMARNALRDNDRRLSRVRGELEALVIKPNGGNVI